MHYEQVEWRLIAPVNMSNFPDISSEKFQSLLAAGNKRVTLAFFLANLKEVVRPWPHQQIKIDQVNYTAKFLTKFSTTTGFSSTGQPFFIHFPTMESLMRTNLQLRSQRDFQETSRFLEWAACQMLFLSGFYFDDAIKVISRNDAEDLGREYFIASAVGNQRKKLLERMAWNFRLWQDFLSYLNWHFLKMRKEASDQLDQCFRRVREKAMLIKRPPGNEPLIKLTGK